MRKAVAYYHLATMGEDYKKLDWEILSAVKYSRLLERLDYLRIGVVGDGPIDLPYEDPKIEVRRFLGGIGQYEYPTMMWLEADARARVDSDDAAMLYFANVGVSHLTDTREHLYPGWRNLCVYYCVHKWRECLYALDKGMDAVSIEWQTDPCPHFSGSFWWARATYLKTLPPLDTDGRALGHKMVRSPRHGTEFWIGMNPACKWASMFQCGMSWRARPMIDWFREAMKKEPLKMEGAT